MHSVYIVKNLATGELEAHSTFNEANKAGGWTYTGVLELPLKRRKRRPSVSRVAASMMLSSVKEEGEEIGYD